MKANMLQHQTYLYLNEVLCITQVSSFSYLIIFYLKEIFCQLDNLCYNIIDC